MTYIKQAHLLLEGKGCSACSRHRASQKLRSSQGYFESKLKKVNPNVSILSQYQNAKTKILCQCMICGFIFHMTPTNLLSGYGCKKCWSERRKYVCKKPEATFIQEMCEKHPSLIVTTSYNGARRYVSCYCRECNGEFCATPDAMLNGGFRCPLCKQQLSKGEKRIKEWLDLHHLKYIMHKTFRGLVGEGGGNLSYGFFLPDYKILIEYQGQFHDGTVSIQTEEALIRQKHHDEIKREFAKNECYDLLEIWYKDYKNIQVILDHYIQPDNHTEPVTTTA